MQRRNVFLPGHTGALLRLCLLAMLALGAAPSFGEEPPLPPELAFLPKYVKPYHVADNSRSWDDTKLRGARLGDGRVQAAMGNRELSGKYWSFPVILEGIKQREPTMALLRRAFVENGWTSVKEWPDVLLLHYTKGGTDAWAVVGAGDAERAWIEMFVSAPPPVSLTLAPPSATPEKLNPGDAGDFPYLASFPGARFRGSRLDPDPFLVTIQQVGQAEVVATGSIVKNYDQLPEVSNSLFHRVYLDGLTTAGWTIVDERQGADMMLSAHYTKNGRNIWANLHFAGGSIEMRVADAGLDVAAKLAKDCHVALYGVLFDFNKSTLQSVSEPVLQQILSLLNKDATLKLEIQGHTDNVGNDAYNQTLSEARARAMVAWLTQHGVAAERLRAKGYGKTVPVADNRSDAGRAKNRRVEIADPRCVAKGT